MAELEFTGRGFAVYGRVTDSRNTKVRVQESSAVGRPHAYVFVEGDPTVYPDVRDASPHLSVEQAQELIAALQRFVEHAASPDNWRNDDDYKEQHG